jgi:hypothetical protein
LPFDGIADAEVERRMKVFAFHDFILVLFHEFTEFCKKKTSNSNPW